MKAFIDTSSLAKKYIDEDGSEVFDRFLSTVSEITVSPIYILEIHSTIERRLKEKNLTLYEAQWIRVEVKKDLHFFSQVLWNGNLEQKALNLIAKYQLKTLDSIQLAAGCLSKSDIFVTSDQKLFLIANREIKKVKLI